jgi:phosphopantetheine--protein transferase-like protein
MKCGVDLVDIARFKRFLDKTPRQKLAQVFTEKEQKECSDKESSLHSLAARFAAKEACMKLFPKETAANEWDFQDIEVATDAFGAPFIERKGKIGQFMQRYAYREISLSITHADAYACAFAVVV